MASLYWQKEPINIHPSFGGDFAGKILVLEDEGMFIEKLPPSPNNMVDG